MKKLLITGGAGFIGANFVNYWIKNYPEDKVIILDDLTYAGNLSSLQSFNNHKNYSFIKGNILDQELVKQIIRVNKIDSLIHFAAESHVDRSISEPDKFIQTNIMGTYSLLNAAKSCWIDEKLCYSNHRFHHISTDEVYGSLTIEEPAFTENTPYSPNSPYSASKASSDHLVRSYHHTYGLNVTTSNCSNNYGPFHFPEKLIPLSIINILSDKSIPVYGDGMQIRDWLYVEDHAYGIDLILKNGRIGENYNIGGNNEWTNIDIIKKVCRIIEERFSNKPSLIKKFPKAIKASLKQTDLLIKHTTDRPGHDRRYAINASKIFNELGYKPKDSFETGIVKTVDWYLENEAWWHAIMDGSYKNWVKEQYSTKL